MAAHSATNAPWHGVPPWHRIGSWLSYERGNFWVAVIYSIAIGLLSLALPLATQTLVNTVAFGSLMQPLLVLSVLLATFLLFSAILQILRQYVVEMIQRRVFVRVASDSADRILRAQASAFDGVHAPELVNRFLEVVTVQKSAAILLVDGLSIVMQTLFGLALLAVYHPFLALIDFFLILGIFLVIVPLGRGAVVTAVKESKAKYEIVAWMQEIGLHLNVFKSGEGTGFALDKMNGLVNEYLNYRGKHFRILLRQISGSLVLQVIASSLLLGVGGFLVINRELTLGQLIASELVLTLVVSNFAKFGKHLESYYDMAAAVDKLSYITDLPEEQLEGAPLPNTKEGASLDVHNLSFAYPGQPPLFDNLCLSVRSGERIGFMASSGDGKSTLIDLIWALRRQSGGRIDIDGHDLRDIEFRDLRSTVAVVRYNEVFRGTIAENVAMGRSGVGAQEVRRALSLAGLLETVSALPEGANTQVSTYGLPLSHGQSMRLALARAIAGNPRLLILDEVLDQVDEPTMRAQLIANLFSRSMPWTVIVATENPDILAHCDRVVEIRDRRIEETGTLSK